MFQSLLDDSDLLHRVTCDMDELRAFLNIEDSNDDLQRISDRVCEFADWQEVLDSVIDAFQVDDVQNAVNMYNFISSFNIFR